MLPTFGRVLGLLINWAINMHPRATQGARTLEFSCLAWRIFGEVPMEKTCPQVGLHSTWWACHDPGLKGGWLFLVWLRRCCCTRCTPNARDTRHHISHLQPMEMMSGMHSWLFDPWSCFDVWYGDFLEIEDDHDTWRHFEPCLCLDEAFWSLKQYEVITFLGLRHTHLCLSWYIML